MLRTKGTTRPFEGVTVQYMLGVVILIACLGVFVDADVVDEIMPESIEVKALEDMGFSIKETLRVTQPGESEDGSSGNISFTYTRDNTGSDTIEYSMATLFLGYIDPDRSEGDFRDNESVTAVRSTWLQFIENITTDEGFYINQSSNRDDYEFVILEKIITDDYIEYVGSETSPGKGTAVLSVIMIIEEPFVYGGVVASDYRDQGAVKKAAFDYLELLKAEILRRKSGSKEGQIEGLLSFNDTIESSIANNQAVIIGIFDEAGILVKTGNTVTDELGAFSFDYGFPVDEGYTIKVIGPLLYMQGDQKLFFVADKEKNEEEAIAIDCGDFIINSKADLVLEAHLYDGKVLNVANSEQKAFNYVYFYENFKSGVEYYRNTLGHSFELNLPLRLVLNDEASDGRNVTGTMAFFDPEDADIYVIKEFSTLFSSYMPSTLFHELSHYVMADMYYPNTGSLSDSDSYHGGYANSDTVGSFTEGFAYFMQYVIDVKINGKSYDPLGNLELNHKAWENSGFSETYAVASTLYDLVDQQANDDDGLSLNIWPQLSQRHLNFGQFYDTLMAAYPEYTQEINQIFIDHGFYIVDEVLEEGRGVYNPGEAFVDSNDNRAYDPGERFVDYNAKDDLGNYVQVYKEGYTIGYAAYNDHLTRKRKVLLPGHFIKTDALDGYYFVEYLFSDQPYLNYEAEAESINGMIYVQIPPSEYNCDIVVYNENDETKDPIQMNSQAFYQEYDTIIDQGYMVADVDLDSRMGNDATQIAYADSLDDDFSMKNEMVEFFSDDDVIFMGLMGLGIGVILTVIVFFVIKKKKI